MPSVIINRHGEPLKTYDSYVNAIFTEALEVFHRARRAVVRAHIAFIGVGALERHPDWLMPPMSEVERHGLLSAISAHFWEHSETAYIRLASYWDRVGQILDFVFFKIRHFERDGFAAVLDRVNLNIVPVTPYLRGLEAWRALRKFQTSESEDGLKWLCSRRNLLVHNLHLQPMDTEPEERLFESLHNHLDARLREKLRPGTQEQELRRLHVQLQRAAALFRDVLAVCEGSCDPAA